MPFFEDMLSSSRGAGFIGTLLALVVLVGFGSLYMFVFDEGLQGGKKSIETLIKEQTQEIQNLELSVVTYQKTIEKAKDRPKTAEEFEKTERLIGLRNKRIEEIKVSREEVNQSMVQIGVEWEQYKEQYRKAERKRAEGEDIGNLLTKSGRSYKNVVIRVVEPLRISFRHSDGNGTVLFDDTPDALIDRFQMTKEAAKAAGDGETTDANYLAVLKAIAEIKQEIAYVDGQMKEAEASYNLKSADKQNIQSRVSGLQSKITQLEGQIAAELNKQGLRNTNRHQAEIQRARTSIAREQAKEADFSRISREYLETKQRRDTEISSWKERLLTEEKKKLQIEKEMRDKSNADGVKR